MSTIKNISHYWNDEIKLEPWCVIEDGFHPESSRFFESIFALGNGYIGQRANFEEKYGGDSIRGNFAAGIFHNYETKLMWDKTGYPEYYSKIVNITNWIGIDIEINGRNLDLANCNTSAFKRTLNMKEGCLERSFVANLESGEKIKICFKRFLSKSRPNIGIVYCRIKPLNTSCAIRLTFYLDGNPENKNQLGDPEHIWQHVDSGAIQNEGFVFNKSENPQFYVCANMKFDLLKNGIKLNDLNYTAAAKENYAASFVDVNLSKDEEIDAVKYVSIVTSRDCEKEKIVDSCRDILFNAHSDGYDVLFNEHKKEWAKNWEINDIIIEGDMISQPAVRFNIFHLMQTYDGKDERLNIPPKGFTGEKYGGCTYWDTEAYCLQYFLDTNPQAAKKLLFYRYNQLEHARENARMIGFSKGALYPMATIEGTECHSEWEITFEEIHRNASIAYAIFNYIKYTGDKEYLYQYGLEVLVEISRFWEQRVSFSEEKSKYVILGVTGPNEYENNVNNNWYTNRMASWTLEYALKTLENFEIEEKKKYHAFFSKLDMTVEEIEKWRKITDNMYYPECKKSGIFLQQDGYMDKEQMLVEKLDPSELPLHMHWSWDRILRSCFIKQADVLQGLYFLKDCYDIETIKRNFDFYEARTVHESSLSPGIHSAIASWSGYKEKAFELFRRSCLLDLCNLNKDTDDGCHITGMAGSLLAAFHGFAGLDVKDNCIFLNPVLPVSWESMSFNIKVGNMLLKFKISHSIVEVETDSDVPAYIFADGKKHEVIRYKKISLS